MPKTIADWEKKGWTAVQLPAGADVVVDFDPATQDMILKGQRFGANGEMQTGQARPKVVVDATDSGVILHSDDLTTVLYKLEAIEA
jgi:hypothetical protein